MKLLTLLMIACLADGAWAEPMDVYFGTGGGGAKGIYRAKFDTGTGKLTQPELAAEIQRPGFLAWHPDGKKLYAVAGVEGGGGVAGYVVKDDGELELINTSVIGDGGGTHIAVHPSGTFLLTAQYGGGSVALMPIDADGRLGESVVTEHEGGSKVVGNRQDSPHPHWCGYSPDGEFAFVPDLGTDNIHVYKVDVAGPSITKHGLASSVPGGGPRHMRFSVDGRFVYLLNELELSVTTFSYDAGRGEAKAISTTRSLSADVKSKEAFNSASEILVHPNGKFVYSANRGHDSVTVYRADPATGRLTVTEVESIRGAWPRNINLDPSGKWLLAAGAHSNSVSVFSIDQDSGALVYQQRSIVTLPGPICILFRN
jgi:6-phosphogluconolactonase